MAPTARLALLAGALCWGSLGTADASSTDPATIAFASSGGDGLEIPLEYLRYPEEEDAEGPYTYRGELILACRPTPPAGKWTLPTLNTKHPVYATARLGDREHLCILDFQRAGSTFYDRLYFDANANGDLTDDPVGDATEPARLPGRFLSPPLDMTVVVDGKSLPYCLRVQATGLDILDAMEMGDEVDVELMELKLQSNCCYRGEFTTGGKSYRVLIGDGNVNGRFGDEVAFSPPAQPDPHLALVRTGDQLFVTAEAKFHEQDGAFLGNRLGLAGELYDLSVDPLGNVLALKPLATEAATVQLTLDPERLSLVTEDGASYLTLYRPGAVAKVPAGKYRIADYQIYRNDSEGDRWYLSATVTPRSKVVDLGAGTKTKLEYGEPYTPAAIIPARVYEAFEKGYQERVEVEFSIGGAGGEVVNDLKRVAGRKTKIDLDATGNFPVEPRFFIMEGSGKITTQGEFEYG